MTTRQPSDGLPDAGAFARPGARITITTPAEPEKIVPVVKNTHVEEYVEAMHYMHQMMEEERAATQQVLTQDVTAPHVFSYGSAFAGLPEVVASPLKKAAVEEDDVQQRYADTFGKAEESTGDSVLVDDAQARYAEMFGGGVDAHSSEKSPVSIDEKSMQEHLDAMSENGNQIDAQIEAVIVEMQQKMEDMQKENIALKELFHDLTTQHEALSEERTHLFAQQGVLVEGNARLQEALSEMDARHEVMSKELAEKDRIHQEELKKIQEENNRLGQHSRELIRKNHALESHLNDMFKEDDDNESVPEPVQSTTTTNSFDEDSAPSEHHPVPPTKKSRWSFWKGKVTKVVVGAAVVLGALWGGFVGKKGSETASQLLMPSATASTPAPSSTESTTMVAPNAPRVPEVEEESVNKTTPPIATPEPRWADPTKAAGVSNSFPVSRVELNDDTMNALLDDESDLVVTPKPTATPSTKQKGVKTSFSVGEHFKQPLNKVLEQKEENKKSIGVAAYFKKPLENILPQKEKGSTPGGGAHFQQPLQKVLAHQKANEKSATPKVDAEWNTSHMGEIYGLFAQLSPQITIANHSAVFEALKEKYNSATTLHEALTTIRIQKNEGVSQALQSHIATVFEDVLDAKQQKALYAHVAQKNFREMIKVVRDKAGVELSRTPVQVWSWTVEYTENPQMVDLVQPGAEWLLDLKTMQLSPKK